MPSALTVKQPTLATGMAAPVPQKTIQPIGAQPPAPAAPAWNPLNTSAEWNELDGAMQLKNKFKELGYTGELAGQQTSTGTGEDRVWGAATIHPDLSNWLKSNNYTMSGRNVGPDMQIGLMGADGSLVGGDSTHYNTNDQSFFEKAMPAVLASAAGYAGLQALGGFGAGGGFGNGAFLGEGVASGIPGWDAAAGLGAAETGSLAAGFEAMPLPGGEGFSFQNVGAAAGEAAPEVAGFNPGALQNSNILGGGLGPVSEALPAIGGPATAFGGLPELAALGAGGGAAAGAGGSSLGGILGGVGSAIKQNPGLAMLGANALGTLAGGSPSIPNAPGSGSGTGQSAQTSQLIEALQNKLYGAGGSLSGLPDYSKIPALQTSVGDTNTLNQKAIDAAYSQQTRMLDPQFARDKQAMESRLAEQGFVPGTPGYERAMSIFGEQQNKAYGGARDSSILQGYQIGQGDYRNALSSAELNNSASRESLAQLLAQRNQPLNELASLKSGQQIDYSNALDKYNAQTASKNSQNQALSQLALALGMYLG